jgi:hypothetical protein
MAVFIVYCLWSAYWLVQGRLPPALFLGLTGWPAPTTGLTRSLLALGRGNWRTSLGYNAMTVPLVVLLFASLGWPAVQCARRQRVALPQWMVWAWLAVLAIAWALKLAGPPGYW